MASNGEVRVDVSFNMDSVKQGLNKVNSAIKSSISASMSAVANVGSAALDGIKNLTIGIGAAATASAAAVTALGKQSIEAYANYEQLVGGVETLFKESAGIVEEYAKHAYETAGMSANQYMETVTSFSASLISSLGGDTQLASEQANVAITDMADNANKMGTALESLRYAYAGFAKQNYTMLDNLKLGYGGTKEEMQRLLKDAQKISGIEYDISNFSDVVSAIHVIQTELHISGLTADEAAKAVAEGLMTEEEAFEAMGTTAREANYTIEGSVRAMKSSWENLLVGLADETQDVDELIDTLMLRIDIVLNNIMPKIEQFLKSFISRLPKMLSGFKDIGKRIVTTISNGLKSNSSAIQNGLKDFLENINKALIESLPAAVENAYGFFKNVFDLVATRIATLDLTKIYNVIHSVIETLFNRMTEGMDDIPDFDNKFLGLIFAIFMKLGTLAEDVLPYISGFIVNILNGAKEFIQSQDFTDFISGVGTKIGEVIQAIYDSHVIPDVIQKTGELINAMINSAGVFLEAVNPQDILTNLLGMIQQIFEGLLPEFPKAILNIANIIGDAIRNLDITDIFDAVGGVISSILSFIIELGKNIIESIGVLIGSIVELILNTNWLEVFTSLFINIGEIIAGFIWDLGKAIFEMLRDCLNYVKEHFGDLDVQKLGAMIIQGVVDGINNSLKMLKDCIDGAVGGAIDDLKDLLGIHSPSRVMYNIGQNLTQGLINGIDSKQRDLLSLTDDMSKNMIDALTFDGKLSASSLNAASYSGSTIQNTNITQTYTVGSMDVTNNKAATSAIDELCNAIQIYSNQKPVLA